jgi:hypothetical protein
LPDSSVTNRVFTSQEERVREDKQLQKKSMRDLTSICSSFRARPEYIILVIIFSLHLSSCAALRQTGKEAKSEQTSPYPLIVKVDPERREQVLSDWRALALASGNRDVPAPDLHPVTATLISIPALNSPVQIPNVGVGGEMTQEETREALRRFIATESRILGTEPQQLSLTTHTEGKPSQVLYEQNAFPYPLRNGFGRVFIEFAADRSIQRLSSTAIPNSEQYRRAILEIQPKWNANELARSLVGRRVEFLTPSGNTSHVIANSEEININELVLYPLLKADSSTLALHIAWEIHLKSVASAHAYLDAITDTFVTQPPGPDGFKSP